MKIEGMGDVVRGRIVVNLWISRGRIGAEFNMNERQACKVMAEITKALSEARKEMPEKGKD